MAVGSGGSRSSGDGVPPPAPADHADIDGPAARHRRRDRRLTDNGVVRAGVVAWSVIGIIVLSVGALMLLGRLAVVIVPLVLALFPAAVLMPIVTRLVESGVPRALAAVVVLVAALGLLVALFGALAPSVAAELGGLAEQVDVGYTQVRTYLENSPLDIKTLPLDQAMERFREQATEQGEDLGPRLLEAGIAVAEGFAGLALAIFTLFFYLKDGPRIAAWVRSVFPAGAREDVDQIGSRVWFTIGAYIRGLLVIGLADAVLIGAGLFALGVPLALPLCVLVFFGALFPIVGAFLAGTVAVLVALATTGLGTALLVLALILIVQQLEGHILTPIMLGRATALHPLGVIAALTAGAVLLGVFGAFLGVPVAASIARAVGYLRNRHSAQDPATA